MLSGIFFSAKTSRLPGYSFQCRCEAPSHAQHTRVAFSVLTALLLTLASACSNSPAPTPTPPTLVLSTVEGPVPPTPTLIPTETPLPSPTPSPTPTLITEPLITEICSPLAVQPLDQITEIITQPFMMPRVMEDGSYKDNGHHGLDLGYYTREGVPFTGTPVLSALDGTIAALVNDMPPYGNMVIIETPFERLPPAFVASQNIPAGNSLYSLYAHLQNLQPLALGDPVTCGQPLAETGLTGFTGGPHLHFETRWGPAGTVFEGGIAFYRADTTEAERANYQLWRMSGTFHLLDPLTLLTFQP